MMSSRYFICLC